MDKLLRYSKAYLSKSRGAAELNYLPEDISVEVTNVCNFKCDYCLQSNPDHFKNIQQSRLAPEQAEVILSKIRNSGVETNVIHWTLDGEPFLNRDFPKICETAIRHGFTNQIFSTNGYYADRALLLPPGALYTLCIDFCPDASFFETHRGTEGAWQTVKSNIEKILANSPGINIKMADISGYKAKGSASGLRKMFNTPRVKVVQRSFHNATGFLNLKPKSGKYHVCFYPFTSFVIASNGDVVICCRDLEHKTVLGNIFHQELSEIWNGNGYQAARKNLLSGKPHLLSACKGCDMPYDNEKFGIRNLIKTAVNRLQIFSR